MNRPTHATVNDREARLRRSLLRLGFQLIDAERGNFHIRKQGRRAHATSDLFGLSLDGVEDWIKNEMRRRPPPGRLTPSEIQSLKQKAKENSAYNRKAFAHLRPENRKTDKS